MYARKIYGFSVGMMRRLEALLVVIRFQKVSIFHTNLIQEEDFENYMISIKIKRTYMVFDLASQCVTDNYYIQKTSDLPGLIADLRF